MNYRSYFFILISFISTSCQLLSERPWWKPSWNLLNPRAFLKNMISRDVQKVIVEASQVEDTPENRTKFAAALARTLDNNKKNLEGGELLLRIIKHCYKLNNKEEMALALAETALKKGANPNTPGRKDKQSVNKASEYGFIPLMKLLIAHGVNIAIEDKRGNRLLHIQVLKNNKEMMELLLRHNPAIVNLVNRNGESPLLLAIKTGTNPLAHLLLEHNANPDLSDNKRIFPLHLAIADGDKMLVNKLITHGATVGATDIDGSSSLLLACKRGATDIITTLLENGAASDLNKPNKQQEYPLFVMAKHIYTERKNPEQFLSTFKIMLDHGADSRQKNSRGETLFHIASKKNAINLMDVLNKHDPQYIHEPDGEGNSPLHNAATEGQYAMVQYLSSYGASLDSRNNRGQTPLLCAIRNNHSAIADLLLRAGASATLADYEGNTLWHYIAAANKPTDLCIDIIITNCIAIIDDKNKNGNTPLHVAAEKNNHDALQVLLKLGARIDVVNNKQQTILHCAASQSHELMKLILEKEGSKEFINMQDDDGNSSLHLAAIAGNTQVLHLLLSGNAKTNTQNNNGQTPFNAACKALARATIRFAAKSKKNMHVDALDSMGYAGIHYVADRGTANDLREILAISGINFDQKTKIEEYTPLHIVTIAQRIECVQILLDKGANVNAQDKESNTALHMASHTNAAICELLLRHPKINANPANDRLQSPLHLALIHSVDSCFDVLIDSSKIDPNMRDSSKCTPLYYAFESKNPSHTVTKLLQHPDILPNEDLKPNQNPLHTAFERDFHLLVPLLAHKRIDLNCKKNGKTIWERVKEKQQIAQLLNVASQAYTISSLGHQAVLSPKIAELEDKLKKIKEAEEERNKPKPVSYPHAQPTAPNDNPPPFNPEAYTEDGIERETKNPPVSPEWDGK